MVNTPRTVNDLLSNLFQDGQPAGSITPQDMRDLIVSMQTSFGGFHLDSAAVTTINSIGVYEKMNGVTTFNSDSFGLDHPTNNEIRSVLDIEKKFFVSAVVEIGVDAGNNQFLGVKLAKNDIVIDDTESIIQVDSGDSDEHYVTVNCLQSLALNDTLSIYVANTTSTSNVEIGNATFHIHSLVT